MCQCWYNCEWHKEKVCGFSNRDIMEVDHIKPKILFPDQKYKLENLMTLCPNCHRMKSRIIKSKRSGVLIKQVEQFLN